VHRTSVPVDEAEEGRLVARAESREQFVFRRFLVTFVVLGETLDLIRFSGVVS
jgi:hypothetical protein